MKAFARLLALWLAASHLLVVSTQSVAAAAAPVPPAQEEGEQDAAQPKFLFWGILLNMAMKLAMSALSSWLNDRLTERLNDPETLKKLNANSTTALIVPLARYALGAKSAGAPANVVVGEPNAPIRVENGQENYQGAHVAIVGFDRQGQATGLRPVSEGFKDGDRIKLKVLPTFDALLVIENITPTGERKQIYPARADEAVRLQHGVEVLLPLNRNDYFEFAGATGDEQLVVTLRDPRSLTGNASTAPANRQDDATGSRFVQETPPGTYPLISQSLKLQHSH